MVSHAVNVAHGNPRTHTSSNLYISQKQADEASEHCVLMDSHRLDRGTANVADEPRLRVAQSGHFTGTNDHARHTTEGAAKDRRESAGSFANAQSAIHWQQESRKQTTTVKCVESSRHRGQTGFHAGPEREAKGALVADPSLSACCPFR